MEIVQRLDRRIAVRDVYELPIDLRLLRLADQTHVLAAAIRASHAARLLRLPAHLVEHEGHVLRLKCRRKARRSRRRDRQLETLEERRLPGPVEGIPERLLDPVE